MKDSDQMADWEAAVRAAARLTVCAQCWCDCSELDEVYTLLRENDSDSDRDEVLHFCSDECLATWAIGEAAR